MNWTGTTYWPEADKGQPLWAVIPAPASEEPLSIEVEGLERLQVEPWKRTADGRIHSYRICGIDTGEVIGDREVTVSTDGPKPPPLKAVPHADIGQLLFGLRLRTEGVDHTETRQVFAAGGKQLAWGPSEIAYQWSGKLLADDKLGTANYTAIATTWHNAPFVQLDLLIHNANWREMKGDFWFRALGLEVPDGWEASAEALYDGAPQLAHVLPMQQGKMFRLMLWSDSLESPPVLYAGQLDADPEGISWANPFCRGYLPQGVPVDWPGSSFDEGDLPPGFGAYAPTDGTYGAMGSSEGVEPYGYVGAALWGETGSLEELQSSILDRQPSLLIDHTGKFINCVEYAEDGWLPWNFYINPMGRGVQSPGIANGSQSWHYSGDPFGFGDPKQPGQAYANKNGLVCPYLAPLLSYGAYDRQHFMRALRATLPLAYICGDRMSVYLLQEHACSARAEFWEGEGDQWKARVGFYAKQVGQHPNQGVALGREDAWALQTVMAACELSPAGFHNQFNGWLRDYGEAIYTGQAPHGLVQALDNGKELDTWAGAYAVCQGYQEDMLAKASAGLWAHWGLQIPGGTILEQCRAIRDMHGANPNYKVPTRVMQWGEVLNKSDAAELADDSQQIAEFVPSLIVTALMQYANDEGERGWLLEWLAQVLGVDSVAALRDWEPSDNQSDRMFASVPPAIAWLDMAGVLE